MKAKNKRFTKGFTLIELAIALAIFGLVIGAMTNVALSVIKAQRKAFALQNAEESARYILESMAKEIRMSLINSNSGDGAVSLNITNSRGENIDYQFDNINKRIEREGEYVSPDNIELTGSFYIRKYASPPRAVVTIVMGVNSAAAKTERQAEINLQTTIAPRGY